MIKFLQDNDDNHILNSPQATINYTVYKSKKGDTHSNHPKDTPTLVLACNLSISDMTFYIQVHNIYKTKKDTFLIHIKNSDNACVLFALCSLHDP